MKITELLEKKDPIAAIQSNVYGNETEYGKVDNSKPNYAGAIGPMQILPSTFNWMKTSGIIPKEYEITNPEHNKSAGDALLAHYFKKYDGDPEKVYAAYYAGPGAINKDGSINRHWRDLKNPKAPNVGQYIAKAMARSGEVPSTRSSETPVKVAQASPSKDTRSSNEVPSSRSSEEPIKVARNDSSISDKLSSAFSDIGSYIRTALSSTSDTNDKNDSEKEIILIINGVKKKFKNKKEAMLAAAAAQQLGQEIKIG